MMVGPRLPVLELYTNLTVSGFSGQSLISRLSRLCLFWSPIPATLAVKLGLAVLVFSSTVNFELPKKKRPAEG
jgi:hypothetical protein